MVTKIIILLFVLFILILLYLSISKAKSTTKMNTMTTDRIRRSEKLTSDEIRSLKKFVSGFPSKLDAAESIGISRPTLDLVIIRGSGNSTTVKLIREKLYEPQTA
jgi:hypothetical protein